MPRALLELLELLVQLAPLDPRGRLELLGLQAQPAVSAPPDPLERLVQQVLLARPARLGLQELMVLRGHKAFRESRGFREK